MRCPFCAGSKILAPGSQCLRINLGRNHVLPVASVRERIAVMIHDQAASIVFQLRIFAAAIHPGYIRQVLDGTSLK